jgi:hypothetical protein
MNSSPNTLFRNNTINGILSIFQNLSSKRSSNGSANDGGSSDDDDDVALDDPDFINNGNRGIKVFSTFCKTTNKNKILHVHIYSGIITITIIIIITIINTLLSLLSLSLQHFYNYY